MNKHIPRIQHVWPQYDPWHLSGLIGIHIPHTATRHSLHMSGSHRHCLKEEKESEEVTFIMKNNVQYWGLVMTDIGQRQHQQQRFHSSSLSNILISMHSGHVIIQSNPIFDMLRADVTIITRGSSVFCLNVVFHNSSPRLVSARQTLPLPPTKIGHHFLQVHCKMKTRQLILIECIFNDSIQLRLFVSSSEMIFKGYFVF